MSAIIRLRSYRVAMGAAGERDVHRRPVGDIQNLLCIRRIGGVTRLLKTLHEVIGAAAVFQRVRIARIRLQELHVIIKRIARRVVSTKIRLPALLVRSEEHTSELQSLMRISYA